MTPDVDLGASAQLYGALDFRVIPLYGVREGRCACRRERCSSPGKHPRFKGWQDWATSDTDRIAAHWEAFPNDNIGLVMGGGVAAIDIDDRDAFATIMRRVPRTVRALTGRDGGGLHLLFKTNGHRIGNSPGALPPGVQVRGEDGFIVAAPSMHASGRRYEWRDGRSPLDVPMAMIPDKVAALIANGKVAQGGGNAPVVAGGDLIFAGGRNAALTSLAGTMRRPGMTEDEILAALLVVNRDRCVPPLPDDEVRRVVRSVAQYAPNLTSDPMSGASEVRLVEVCAADLLAADAPEVPPSLPVLGVDGVITRGWSHLLAAYPKVGKTELLTALCHSWRDVRIAYFTEEPQSVWRARLGRRPGDWEHVVLIFATGVAQGETLKRILAGEENVVIIDTVRTLLALDDENDNAKVGRALTPYIAACREADKTLIFSHHTRKVGGEHGRAIAGGHAFLGAVDVGLELGLENPNAPTRRHLKGQARVVEVPDIIFDRAGDGQFRVVATGGLNPLALDTVKERVLDVLASDQKKTNEVLDMLGGPPPSPDQVTKALNALARDETTGVHRDPPISEGGRKGKTYLWHRTN